MTPVIDLDAYRRDGFLVGRFPLFEPARLAALDSIAEQYRQEVADGRRQADLNVPHFSDPRLFEWLMSAQVLDLVEPLLGPDIALWTSQFFCKAPGTGQAIGWHADGHYWQGYLDPLEVVSLWLALDPTDGGNGGMRVVRGSHRRRDLRYVARGGDDNPFFPIAVAADQVDPRDVVTIELARGEFLMFDAWLVHGSEANRSQRPRRGFSMRYMPATSRFYAAGRSGVAGLAKQWLAPVIGALRGRPVYRHQIYLARGSGRDDTAYSPWVQDARVRRTPSVSDICGT